jgi:hypothetical protein
VFSFCGTAEGRALVARRHQGYGSAASRPKIRCPLRYQSNPTLSVFSACGTAEGRTLVARRHHGFCSAASRPKIRCPLRYQLNPTLSVLLAQPAERKYE